jgi:hypothetical protein
MIHDTYMISINSSTEACPGKSFLLPSYAFGVASVKALRPTPEILTTSRGIPARLFSDSSECRAKDEAPSSPPVAGLGVMRKESDTTYVMRVYYEPM